MASFKTYGNIINKNTNNSNLKIFTYTNYFRFLLNMRTTFFKLKHFSKLNNS